MKTPYEIDRKIRGNDHQPARGIPSGGDPMNTPAGRIQVALCDDHEPLWQRPII